MYTLLHFISALNLFDHLFIWFYYLKFTFLVEVPNITKKLQGLKYIILQVSLVLRPVPCWQLL